MRTSLAVLSVAFFVFVALPTDGWTARGALTASEESAFRQAMSEGFMALDAGNPMAAEAAFGRALALSPRDPAAQDGMKEAKRQVTAMRAQEVEKALQEHLEYEEFARAKQALEELETLSPSAATPYREPVLGALEAERGLDRYLTAPRRLETPAGRDMAQALVADETDYGGRIATKRLELQALLAERTTFAKLVLNVRGCRSVRLKPGREVGAKRITRLEVRPGAYQVIGTRPGYRDFRQQISLAPGEERAMEVSCRERF